MNDCWDVLGQKVVSHPQKKVDELSWRFKCHRTSMAEGVT